MESRRGQRPEPLRRIDEGLHPVMLKLKEIGDYLPDTLKAKKSELDGIDFIEAMEMIEEYAKKLPPPESFLDSDDLIVVHNWRVSMEGGYKLLKSRFDAVWEELGVNLRKRGPQKPRKKRPAPRMNVPTEEQAAAKPPPSSLDIPNLEQIFNDLILTADPTSITLLEDVPMRQVGPEQLFRMGFDDEPLMDGGRAMPMDAPHVGPQWDVGTHQEVMEVVPVEEFSSSRPLIEESTPSVQSAGIPVPPEPMLADPLIIPEIVFEEPSRPTPAATERATPRFQRSSLEKLLDNIDKMPVATPAKRQRKNKIEPNKCRKRGVQLTRKQVNRAMAGLNPTYEQLIYEVVMDPKPEPDDDNPCLYPSLNIRKWGKYMPEFSEEEIADRNLFTSIADGLVERIKALGGATPIRHGTLHRVRSSGVSLHTPLGAPDISGEPISAPHVHPDEEAVPVVEPLPTVQVPLPRDGVPLPIHEVAEKLQARRRIPVQSPPVPHIQPLTPMRAFPEGVPSSSSKVPAMADMAMDVGLVGLGPATEEFPLIGEPGGIDGFTHDEQRRQLMGPPAPSPTMGPLEPEVSPEEAARRSKEERRVNRQIRRVGNDESTDESTLTLNTGYLLLEEELVAHLKRAWAEDSSRMMSFAELCPPGNTSRERAARTFEILINLAGSFELNITQTSAQPQDIVISSSAASPRRSSRMSFTLVKSSSGSNMSMTLDTSTPVSTKPSQSPSASSG